MAVQQLMADAAVIALNRAFGFGPVRAAKFLDAMNQAATDMADLIMEDTNDTEYSRTKIDNELRGIVGEENFTPWDERYKAAINPNRGNREQRRARKKRGHKSERFVRACRDCRAVNQISPSQARPLREFQRFSEG